MTVQRRWGGKLRVQSLMSKQDEKWKNHHETQEELDLQIPAADGSEPEPRASHAWLKNRFHFVKYRLYHNTQTQNRMKEAKKIMQ